MQQSYLHMKSYLQLFPRLFCFGAFLAVTGQCLPVNAQTNSKAGFSMPDFKVVESDETTAKRLLQAQVRSLLEAKAFGKLDALAKAIRATNSVDAEGVSTITKFYLALDIPEKTTEADAEKILGLLREWKAQNPNSITPNVALAMSLTSYGWLARGTKYADKVTEDGWRLFQERLTQAAAILKSADKLPERCPQYWMVWMRIGIGLGMDRTAYDGIVNRAIKEFPGLPYYQITRSKYLLPKWHGKPGEWESEIEKAAAKLGSEEGDLLYARAAWELSSQYPKKTTMFQQSKISWARVDRGLSIMEKRYPNSLQARSIRCRLAAQGAGPIAAKSAFDALSGRIDVSIWETEEYFRTVAAWVYRNQKPPN